MSFSKNFDETSLGNDIIQDSGEFYKVFRKSFIKVYIELTPSVRFCLSCDFSALKTK